MRIVLASGNIGKAREFQQLLKPLNIELILQSDLGIDAIEETATTFVENALIKARHAARLSGLPALADDSGLCVYALNGAPGIYSARYAGLNKSSEQHIQKLLFDLQNISDKNREAYFHCTLAFLTHADDPVPLICEGNWHGKILETPRGAHGFGYDPIFYVEHLQKTVAELPMEIKNNISHRKIALEFLMKALPNKIKYEYFNANA